MSHESLSELAEELGRSLCRCSTGQCDLLTKDLGLCRTLLHLLSAGRPVSADELARASGRSRQDILAVIHASGDVELDSQGHIVGAGLSLQPTPHKLRIDDRLLYTWCALDALMYPPLLDMAVEIESPCAATGASIRVQLAADGVHAVTPAEAVVSVVKPVGSLGVRQGFCTDVHFFRSAQAAATWLEQHPGALLLSVADAFRLGQQLVHLQ